MKVLLLQSVKNVGLKNEVVEVAPGYAAHALFPKKLAIPATDEAVQKVERTKKNKAAQKQIHQTLLHSAIAQLTAATVMMPVKANEQGNLFSKLSSTDITHFLQEKYRLDIDPACIHMPGDSIKKLGAHTITVIDGDFQDTFSIVLVAA